MMRALLAAAIAALALPLSTALAQDGPLILTPPDFERPAKPFWMASSDWTILSVDMAMRSVVSAVFSVLFSILPTLSEVFVTCSLISATSRWMRPRLVCKSAMAGMFVASTPLASASPVCSVTRTPETTRPVRLSANAGKSLLREAREASRTTRRIRLAARQNPNRYLLMGARGSSTSEMKPPIAPRTPKAPICFLTSSDAVPMSIPRCQPLPRRLSG